VSIRLILLFSFLKQVKMMQNRSAGISVQYVIRQVRNEAALFSDQAGFYIAVLFKHMSAWASC
jgi:hypothetical protein